MASVGYRNIYLQEHWDRQRFNEEKPYCLKERECTSLLIDANSAARNTASVVKSISPLPIVAGCLVSSSAVIGGVLGFPIGLAVSHNGFRKMTRAVAVGDAEGVVHNALYGSFGAGYVGTSVILAADGIMGLQGGALPAAMIQVFGSLGFVMNGALLGYSTYGLHRASQFNTEMKAVLEKEGGKGVLNWLHEKVSLTRGEATEISQTAKDPAREMAKALQRKWNALELRTSPECAALVREKLPGLIEKFDPKEASILINMVQKANFKTRIKHFLLLLIAAISIAAFLCLSLTTGPASPLLFAIAAVTWFTVDSSTLHNYIGEKCWSWHLRSR